MHYTRRYSFVILAAVLVWTPLSAGQTPVATGQAAQSSAGGPSRQYRIGPGDSLQISFIGLSSYDADMNGIAPIQSNGMIEVKYLNSVNVAGMTTLEVQDELIKRLEAQKLFAPGTVRAIVQMAEYRKQSVIVSGAVRTPGVVELTGDQMEVNRAIAQANGYAANAGQIVEIVRSNPNGGPQVVTVTRDQLESNDDPGLFENDRINVPVGEVFFVNGEVNNQGEKPWEPGMTVQKALSMSGGTTPKFSLGRSKIQRPVKDENGNVLKYNDVKDLKPETVIQADDILVAGRKWM